MHQASTTTWTITRFVSPFTVAIAAILVGLAIVGSVSFASAKTKAAYDHIFVIVMENHSASQIIGSAAAPFINELAASYGLAANYTAVSHPSLPNYLALTGGSTFGLSTDCTGCFQNAPNIAVDRVAASGRAWRAYMESMPSPAFVGDAYPYMQKHDPFVYYDNIRTDPAQFANVVPYTQLAKDLSALDSTPSYG